MQTIEARPILQSLVQGLDPQTGQALAGDHVLRRGDIASALLAALTALESEALRARRRAQLPQNVGRPWGSQEEAELTSAFRAHEPLREIAARHRRTLAAIEARLEALGLITPEQRSTRNRYITRAGAHRGSGDVPAGRYPRPSASVSSPESSVRQR